MVSTALDIRCRYALCRVASIVEGTVAAEKKEAKVYLEAFDLGLLSSGEGDPNVPVLFRKEPFLTEAWKDGFDTGYQASVLAVDPSTPLATSPGQLLSLLRATNKAEIEGFFLSLDEDGIWMTNPYGIDCALMPFSPEGCKEVLLTIERSKNRDHEWAIL